MKILPYRIPAQPPPYLRPVLPHLVLIQPGDGTPWLGAEAVCKTRCEVALLHQSLAKRRVVVVGYDFAIGGDKVFDVIKKGDSKLKAWGEGFGVNAGFIYEF